MTSWPCSPVCRHQSPRRPAAYCEMYSGYSVRNEARSASVLSNRARSEGCFMIEGRIWCAKYQISGKISLHERTRLLAPARLRITARGISTCAHLLFALERARPTTGNACMASPNQRQDYDGSKSAVYHGNVGVGI